MKKKKGKIPAIMTLLLLGSILAGLTIFDMMTPDRKFSFYENRILASRPAFSFKSLFDGSYTADYETYVTDQFVYRDGWITWKTATDVVLGKTEVGGVYLATDKTLIEQHLPEEINEADVEKCLALLAKLEAWQEEAGGSFRVMLVPTADNILTDKLPAYAAYYDQQDFQNKMLSILNDKNVINVADSLREHKQEKIYYGTDHHWTTLGAYYGYLVWAESTGVTEVSYNVEKVSEDFLGTLHSAVGLPMAPDVIEAYQPESLKEGGKGMQVYYDFAEEPVDTLYAPSHLGTKNQYAYFLDDNHPFIRIETGTTDPSAAGKSLFVIKDSYANCMIPFLTEHYETVYVLDLRYYNAGLFALLEDCSEEKEMDILVLYNVIHFIENFRYRE